MRSLRNAIVIGTALFGVTSIASAQGTPIPAQYMPPAGMCRVWLNGVFPAQQPAPTTCDVARANLRPNSRLIYGPSLRGVPVGQQGPVMTNGRIGQGGQSVCTDANRDGICDYRQQGNGNGQWDNRGNGRWDNRSDKERRKAERREEKERRKEWKRDHKRGHHDGDDEHDDDDDDDRYDRGRDSRGNDNGNYGRGSIGTIPGVGRVSFP